MKRTTANRLCLLAICVIPIVTFYLGTLLATSAIVAAVAGVGFLCLCAALVVYVTGEAMLEGMVAMLSALDDVLSELGDKAEKTATK